MSTLLAPSDAGRMAETLDAAFRLTGHGWPVFILGPGKIPLPNCRTCRAADGSHDMEACRCPVCHGFYAATCDRDRLAGIVAAHPDGLLAVRTGAPSGTVVVDVDPRNGGTDTFRDLAAAGLLPETVTARTAGGGIHLYYAHPGVPVKSGGNRAGRGVDIKADGAYVVAPPSVTGTGAYSWERDPARAPLVPLSAGLLERINRPPARPAPAAGFAPTAAPVSGFAVPTGGAPARLAGLVTVLLSTPEGSRNDVLNWASYKAAELICGGAVPAETVVAILTDAAARIGLAAGETRATIASGLRAGGAA